MKKGARKRAATTSSLSKWCLSDVSWVFMLIMLKRNLTLSLLTLNLPQQASQLWVSLMNSCISTSESMTSDVWTWHACYRELRSHGHEQGVKVMMGAVGVEDHLLPPQHFLTHSHVGLMVLYKTWVDSRVWAGNPIKEILYECYLVRVERSHYHIVVKTIEEAGRCD